MRSLLAVLACLIGAGHVGAFTLEAEPFIDHSLSEPMFLTAPQGDADYLYVGLRRFMQVRVFDRDTGAYVGNFLDLPDASPFAQDGLLWMAFHPEYDTNGLYYTYTHRNSDSMVRVTEYRRSPTNPLLTDPTYERQILQVPNTNSHNGGWLGFSPVDGHLYITTGDGGANNGAANGLPAQDPLDLKGKLLRVDVSGDDFPENPDFNYSIPSTNPFASGGGAPEIFALGLRHPFRAGFDSDTGDLYIGDVGSTYFEEINVLPAGTNGGQNFGWRAREGSEDNPFVEDPSPPDPIDPIHEYATNPGGASVIGGVVYRGSEMPELQGTYFFGDFNRHQVHTLEYTGAAAENVTDRTYQLFEGQTPIGPVAFGEDGLGEVYIVSYLTSTVFKLSIAPDIVGDYNEDGRIDAADYTVWRDNYGEPEGTLPNDPNGGVIGMAQYNTWVDAYLEALSIPSTSNATPEPVSSAILLAGAAMLLATRRTHKPR